MTEKKTPPHPSTKRLPKNVSSCEIGIFWYSKFTFVIPICVVLMETQLLIHKRSTDTHWTDNCLKLLSMNLSLDKFAEMVERKP